MSTRFGIVSTCGPTRTGAAGHTDSLRTALIADGAVIRVVEQSEPRPARHVIAQWIAGAPESLRAALQRLNSLDIAVIQHDLRSFGDATGSDGADTDPAGESTGHDLLALLDGLRIPSVVVLHSVPAHPGAGQRELLEAVLARAGAVVVPSASARARLGDYSVDQAKVHLIGLGAAGPADAVGHTPTFRTAQPTVLSWGLLSPGKGIEWGIEAMARLRGTPAMPRYVIAGVTESNVLRRDGESYRVGLHERVRRLALSDVVAFDSRYRDAADLATLVRSADVVLLPGNDDDQTSSAVLVEAIAAEKPVIATPFPHARELLAGTAGLLTGYGDPAAIAEALRSVLTRPAVATGLIAAASATAGDLSWPTVARRYRELAEQLIRDSVPA